MVVVTPLDWTSVLMLGAKDGDVNTPAALQIKLKSPDCCGEGDGVGVSFFWSCTFLTCFSLSRCWFMLSGPVNCLLHTLHSRPPGALLLAPVDGEILRVERLFSTSFSGVTVNPSKDFLKDSY